MEKRKQSISIKSCEVVQEEAYLPYPCTLDEIEMRARNISNVTSYTIGIHDKDEKEDGTLKSKHFHCVLTFSSAQKVSVIAKAFEVKDEYVNKVRDNPTSAKVYVSHRNAPDKYQYDLNCIRASYNYEAFIQKQQQYKVETWDYIRDSIESGIITRYNYFRGEVLSLDACVKYEKRILSALDVIDKRKEVLDRTMNTIYIYGGSATGKTSYAKVLARAAFKESEICNASSGKNPFDDYNGEPCLIVDDFRSSVMSFADFLKMSDNHTNSRTAARYHNKSMGNLRLLILTSIKHPTELYHGVQNDDENEPLLQIKRRFPHLVKMTTTDILTKEFSFETGEYEDAGRCPNPYSFVNRVLQNPSQAVDEVKELFRKTGIVEVKNPSSESIQEVYKGFAHEDKEFLKRCMIALGELVEDDTDEKSPF